MKIILITLLLFLPVAAQSRDEFDQKYGASKNGIYVARPGVAVVVKFASESLWGSYASDVVIKPERMTTSSMDGAETMASELVLEVIDEVVPVARRGRLINEMSVNGGCTGMRISLYEKVSISCTTRCEEAGGGTYQALIKWKTIGYEGKR